MEKIKDFIYQNQDKIKYPLFAGLVISAIVCLARSDFNFVFYLYVLYVWEYSKDLPQVQNQEKFRCFLFFLATIPLDVIFTIFWTSRWQGIIDFESNVHVLVSVVSWIGIILKVKNII